MTRAEILDCLTDRPCDYCKFHESGRCERWNCVFEEKPDDCEDAISRQAAQDYIAEYLSQYLYDDVRAAVEVIDEYIGELPPVTPKQKMGHWILTDDDFVYCSECEDSYYPRPIDASWYYCPHCGAKMEESEE